MRSVVDQIPRLLAAMEYIAQENKGTAGSFEMFYTFPVVRRIFHTGAMHAHSGSGKVNYPVAFDHIWVSRKMEKGATRHVGRIEIGFKVDRSMLKNFQSSKKLNSDSNQSLSISLVLGTLKGGYLLQTASFIVPNYQNGTWTKTVGLDFDWDLAEANGSDDKCVVLRVVHEFAHSIDLELVVLINDPE
jgi:hypothetical protein